MRSSCRWTDRDEGAVALEAGRVDGFASDKLLLAGAQIKRPEALVLLPDDLSIERSAIVLPRGDWALRLAVRHRSGADFRSGKTFEVFERWFFGARPSLLLQAIYAWESRRLTSASRSRLVDAAANAHGSTRRRGSNVDGGISKMPRRVKRFCSVSSAFRSAPRSPRCRRARRSRDASQPASTRDLQSIKSS